MSAIHTEDTPLPFGYAGRPGGSKSILHHPRSMQRDLLALSRYSTTLGVCSKTCWLSEDTPPPFEYAERPGGSHKIPYPLQYPITELEVLLARQFGAKILHSLA
jgi:hypothetical protein